MFDQRLADRHSIDGRLFTSLYLNTPRKATLVALEHVAAAIGALELPALSLADGNTLGPHLARRHPAGAAGYGG